MLSQWEQFTNMVGGDVLKSGEFARAVHGATAGTMQAQEAINGVMDRALAAANIISRSAVNDTATVLP